METGLAAVEPAGELVVGEVGGWVIACQIA